MKLSKWDGWRAALDRDPLDWIVVHDLRTREALLSTPACDDLVSYALSSDGRYVAVLTSRRLELYAVPEAGVRKRAVETREGASQPRRETSAQ